MNKYVPPFETLNSLENIIEFEKASVENNGNLILSDLNIAVKRGEFVYITGKVGSGKSSFIKSVIAELPVTSGKARVGDFYLNKIKRRKIPYLRRHIGVVFQDFQLLLDRTIEENLVFVLQATGWKNMKEMRERACDVLSMVGLETKSHKMPHQLSGGEQQRVAIARAILNEPSIFLADEPTGNLDRETTKGIMDLLMSIYKKTGSTVIIVTHNMEIVNSYPGRNLVCENGTIRPRVQEAIDIENVMKEADVRV